MDGVFDDKDAPFGLDVRPLAHLAQIWWLAPFSMGWEKEHGSDVCCG
jgi:hypothetical protein